MMQFLFHPEKNVKAKLFLASLRFCDFLSWAKANLWPGSKGVPGKKHRREKNSIRRSPRASAERGGSIGRPGRALLQGNNQVVG